MQESTKTVDHYKLAEVILWIDNSEELYFRLEQIKALMKEGIQQVRYDLTEERKAFERLVNSAVNKACEISPFYVNWTTRNEVVNQLIERSIDEIQADLDRE